MKPLQPRSRACSTDRQNCETKLTFWKAGFWNMEFIAFMSKPGGMPGRPGGMPAPPPAAPSPSAPPRRRRAGIVCGQGKHGEGSAETSVHVEDVSVAATDALRLAAARRYSVGGAQGGAGAHPQMRAARGAPPRCRASLPRPGRGAACPARRTGSSSHFPICALPAARSPLLLQHAARPGAASSRARATQVAGAKPARRAQQACWVEKAHHGGYNARVGRRAQQREADEARSHEALRHSIPRAR